MKARMENRMPELVIGNVVKPTRMPLWMVIVPFIGLAAGFAIGYFAQSILGF